MTVDPCGKQCNGGMGALDKPVHAALEFLGDKWGDFTSVAA